MRQRLFRYYIGAHAKIGKTRFLREPPELIILLDLLNLSVGEGFFATPRKATYFMAWGKMCHYHILPHAYYLLDSTAVKVLY